MRPLININRYLHEGIKARFMHNIAHQKLTNDISILNEATLEFHNQAKCYKLDLAKSLQNLFECYNSIFIKQYEAFYKTENEKEASFEYQLKEVWDQKEKQDKWE